MRAFDGLLDRWLRRTSEPEVEVHDEAAVWATPERYTRASRRAVGYTKPVGIERMRAANAARSFLPRTARRHVMVLLGEASRQATGKHKARIARALARRGLSWA